MSKYHSVFRLPCGLFSISFSFPLLIAAHLLAAAPSAHQSVRLIAPASYVPGLPVPIQVEILSDGARAIDLWNVEVLLTVDHPGAVIVPDRIQLVNGIGTTLLTLNGASNSFSLIAAYGDQTAQRSLQTLAGTAAATVSGTLPGSSSSWSGLVRIGADVIVPTGHTLSVAPGTWVLIDGVSTGTAGPDLIVNGSVQALGSEPAPIVITCSDPALNWGQIAHRNAQPSLYRFAFINKAGRAPGEGHTGTGPALRPENSQITFENCIISDLTSAGGTVGKIMMASGSDLTFANSVFARARMGPEIAGTALLCTNSCFMQMTGPDDADGIYLHSSGGRQITLTHTLFFQGDDDAVDTLDSVVTIDRCIIRDWPNPNEDAKGISAFNGEVRLYRSLIVDCFMGVSAKSSGPLAKMDIQHSTITGITVGVAASYKANATAGNILINLTNSIVRSPNAIHTDFGATNFSIGHCNLSESWPGQANQLADPLFLNAAGGNYRLQPGSPCIDAGDPSFPLDPDGTLPDLGAFPFDATTASGFSVALVEPLPGATLFGPTNLLLRAQPYSSTGTVTRVEFFETGRLIGQSAQAPWSAIWSNVFPGQFTLSAVAANSSGLSVTSSPVRINVISSAQPTTNTLVPRGAIWKYLDDGSNQSTAWVAPAFNDSTWLSDDAEFGYGDNDENTVVSFGPDPNNKIVTTYFRHSFNVDDPSRFDRLPLRLVRDDGAILYLNGRELRRFGMPSGAVTYRTYASNASNYPIDVDELSPADLVPGTNWIAVEIHQGNARSSDISFDLELLAIALPPTNLPPVVRLTAPLDGTHLAAPADVSWAAEAFDPDGSITRVRFFANGALISDLTNPPYAATWPGAPAGPVDLTVVATDDTGQSSTSPVVHIEISTDIAPPVLAQVIPAPSTLLSLNEITVTFSKAVRGVDAPDLLLNGWPAETVTGAGNTYTFYFAQPAYGTVRITWTATHGITDLFSPAHSFDSSAANATWSYLLRDVLPPRVASVLPGPDTIVTRLSPVSVLFTEPVEGVDPADLRANGIAAASVRGTGAGPYQFSFNSIPSGTVEFQWLTNAAIRDLSANPFLGSPWNAQVQPQSPGVIITEIMYHPASEDVREEFIELFNTTEGTLNLTGWQLTAGVQFTFPSLTLGPKQYAVVAANLAIFTTLHPQATRAVGDWEGILSNQGERIELRDALGNVVDQVEYADKGDWAVRARGDLDLGHRGWNWLAPHDGEGSSLELINPALPNDFGQNWAPSLQINGSPQAQNSSFVSNIPPLVLDVAHFPIVPSSSNPVIVTARILDESPDSAAVALHYRPDARNPLTFQIVTMTDDGVSPDAAANDRRFTALIPPHTNNTVIEFFVSAADSLGQIRSWPAPAQQLDGAFAQTANALFQVDDAALDLRYPLFKLIMTEAERAELEQIGDGCYSTSTPCESQSNAQMNGSFVSFDQSGAQIRYTVGIRNRGHGTRNRTPNNFRVNFPSERTWQNITALNLNSQFSWLQHFGAVLALRSGVAGAHTRPVQVRVNNADLSQVSFDRTYGLYAANEVLNSDWADLHFPEDGGGNIYRAMRDQAPSGFTYRGEDPAAYTNTWFKATNESEDDWSDLIAMLRVLDGTNVLSIETVNQVIRSDQWLRHLALMALFNSRETGLNTGDNDDYFMYRGIRDPRFILMFYDLDTILGQGSSSGSATGTVFGAATIPVLDQLLHHPELEPIYYQTLRNLIDTTFSAEQFNALLDDTIPYVPETIRSRIKTWMDSRRAYVRSILPVTPALPEPRALLSGIPRSPTPLPTANFAVTGSQITAYQFQLNGAAWSDTRSVATPIDLAALPPGTNTLAVIGQNSAGRWQDPTHATTVTWLVDPAWPAIRINEVLALNTSTLAVDGAHPDLVELYNEGPSAVSLSGLRLTDNPALPGKFTFPASTSLAAGDRLVVYANSGTGGGFHLGFALDSEGDALYLFDRAASVDRLLDSVEFGLQIPDFSLGRVGPSGEWLLTRPTFGQDNQIHPLADPALLRINEWIALGQPPFARDFVELFNPQPEPAALGSLFLSDHPIGAPRQHPIAALSFIAPQGYVSFDADGDPEQGANHLSFKLAAEYGEIGLLDQDGTSIDHIVYGPQWLGVAMGRCPDGAPNVRALESPTPNASNHCPLTEPPLESVSLLPLNASWAYDATGTNLGAIWIEPDYDHSRWPAGAAPFGYDQDPLPAAIQTRISDLTKFTYYFRTSFVVPTNLTVAKLQLTHLVDDGAAFYLNGQELTPARFNLPAGPIDYQTPGTAVGNADFFTVILNPPGLLPGTNTLAVEVHQNSPTSGDLVFGLTVDALIATNTAGAVRVVLNEILANNQSLEELDGSTPDWVELFNPTSAAVDLAGFSLSDSLSLPPRWTFPPGALVPANGHLLIRCDSTQPPSALNAGFGLDSSGGSVYLLDRPENNYRVVSSISYGLQAANWTLARIPDGSAHWTLAFPTPAEPNRAANLASTSRLSVNEWLAAPITGDDWFEIFNPESQPVALSGLYLTDDLADPDKVRIPPLSFIGTGIHAYQRFEADDQTSGNHVRFKLSAQGDWLAIADTNAVIIQSVRFGLQQPGVSQGRLPDGAPSIVPFPGTASPAESNFQLHPAVLVNELLSHSDPPLEDAVEFSNPTGDDLPISGWFVSDSPANLKKFQVPPGIVVPAGAQLVLYEGQFNSDAAAEPFSFSSAKGDDIYLSEATPDGALTGLRAFARFGGSENGVTFGRVPTTVGDDFAPLRSRTFGVDQPASVEQFRLGNGLPNSGPKVGPVLISEIMYQPVGDADVDEFIELQNNSAVPVPLFDPAHPTNTWRLRKGVEFNFPPNITLPAYGLVLIVRFDPIFNPTARRNFETRFGANGPLVGPFSGRLDNSGDLIELQKPDSPQTVPGPEYGMVPYVLVERVIYDDLAPWPNAAGSGSSLQRANLSAYSNDPVNWIAAAPTAGLPLATDFDHDGLPDSWEAAFNFDPRNAADAAADPDADGLSNLAEFLSGTDPRNASSTLRVDATLNAFGFLELTFVTTPGRSYAIEFTEALGSNLWIRLATVPPSQAATLISIPDSPADTHRFYRLIIP